MRRLLVLALFLASAVALGQGSPNAADPMTAFAVRLDGGLQIPAGYLTIQDEGGNLTQRNIVNFIGGGVTCADNAGQSRTDCTIPSGSGLGDPGGNGFVIRTALNTTINRTLVSGNGAITVTNADGTAGNPTVTGNVFVASGGSHAIGLVPDPGATAGTAAYLREDATFVDPFLDTQVYRFDEDWYGAIQCSTNTSGSGAAANYASGGAAHPSIRTFSTGAATGVAGCEAFNTNPATVGNILLGGGVAAFKSSVQINSIGDGTDIVHYTIGLCDKTATTVDCTNGIYFLYDRANSTTNWRFKSVNGGTSTLVDCGAVGTAAYHTYSFVANAGLTSVTGSIDGSACVGGAITTNLPTNGATWMVRNDKTAGATTVFNMDVDYIRAVIHLTTTR